MHRHARLLKPHLSRPHREPNRFCVCYAESAYGEKAAAAEASRKLRQIWKNADADYVEGEDVHRDLSAESHVANWNSGPRTSAAQRCFFAVRPSTLGQCLIELFESMRVLDKDRKPVAQKLDSP